MTTYPLISSYTHNGDDTLQSTKFVCCAYGGVLRGYRHITMSQTPGYHKGKNLLFFVSFLFRTFKSSLVVNSKKFREKFYFLWFVWRIKIICFMNEYSISDSFSKKEKQNSLNAHSKEMCCPGLWNCLTDRDKVCQVPKLERKGNSLNSKVTAVWQQQTINNLKIMQTEFNFYFITGGA